jgi:hypothetical protein
MTARGLAAVHAAAGAGLPSASSARSFTTAAPPSAATAPISAQRAEAIVNADAAAKERGAEASDRLGGAMQRYLAKVLPQAAMEANTLDLEMRVAPGDGAQLRLAKVCARHIMQLCGEQKAAPAIQHARAVASGAGGAFMRADHRAGEPRGVLAAVRRR